METAGAYSSSNYNGPTEEEAEINDDKLAELSSELDLADDKSLSSSNSTVDDISEDAIEFFDSFHFKKVDFSDMLSTANPCLLSGDGFMLEIINYRYLNHDLGGQILPIIYLLEQFLHELKKFGGSVKIIWFKDMESLFQRNEFVHFVYSVLNMHSKRHLNSIEINNPYNGEWCNYLSHNRPPLIFMLATTDSMVGYFSADTVDSFKVGFACIIYFAFQNSVQIINISGLQKSLNNIKGYFVEENPRYSIDIYEDSFVEIWLRNIPLEYSCANLIHTFETVEEFWIKILQTVQEDIDDNSHETVNYMQAFALYLTCLKRLPLSARCFTSSVSLDYGTKKKMEAFTSAITRIASSLLPSSTIEFPISDLFDGKLFLSVYCNFDYLLNIIKNDSQWFDSYCALLPLCILSNVSQPHGRISLNNLPPTSDEHNNEIAALAYKFDFEKNPLFRAYFGKNSPTLDLAVRFNNQLPQNKFFERYHWHSGKLLSEELQNSHQRNDNYKNAKQLNKMKQYNKNWIHFYGNSLVGLETQSNSKIAKVSKARCILNTMEMDSVERKITKKEKKFLKQTKHSKEIAEHISKKQAEVKKFEEIDHFNKRIVVNNLSFSEKMSIVKHCLLKSKFSETKATLLFCQFELLVEEYKCDLVSIHGIKRGNVILLMENIKHITNMYLNFINEKQKVFIAKCLLQFGFNVDVIRNLGLITDFTQFSNIDFTSLSATFGKKFHETQLRLCGHIFGTQENPQADQRVPHFVPDLWQVKLLDIVDQKKSALIIAPTSAGKTFISYYCIEKTLLETKDGIVVYVSPTKALVNQVAATIYARLGKLSLKTTHAIYGEFTRDYRENVLNCRVLVTVPQCFEILLLSPERLKWKSKIRYVIFDEVHCIGQDKGDSSSSEVWEHIMLLNQSPFLALSATVSNPKILQRWLTLAETLKQNQWNRNDLTDVASIDQGVTVELVEENERIAEFEMFLYNHSKNCLEKLHPFSTLQLQNIKSVDALFDIQLTAEQCFELYFALLLCQNTIKPADFFSNITWLCRSDLRKYEATLKQQFYNLIETDICRANFVVSKLNGAVGKTNFMKRTVKSFTQNTLMKNILPFAKQLLWTDKLPCLLFLDNRRLCEKMAMRLSSHACFWETKFKHLPRNKGKIAKYNKDVKEYKNIKKRVKSIHNEIPYAHESCSPAPEYKKKKKAVTVATSGVKFLMKNRQKKHINLSQNILDRKYRKWKEWEREEGHTLNVLEVTANKNLHQSKSDRYEMHKFYNEIRDAEDYCFLPPENPFKKSKKKRRRRKLFDEVSDVEESCISPAECPSNEYRKKKKPVFLEVYKEKNYTEQFCLSAPTDPFKEQLKKYSFRKPNENVNLLENLKERLFLKDGRNKSTIAFYNCLRHGVGYHHSGLSTTMRKCVEILFRSGLLRIVFSTATLAQGINMPCRTVVFCCDSPYLNSLAYRQMSGRAGRRGFDNRGNIIFYGIPSQKIVRLICSKLPCLKGNLPFKTSYILRLLVLTSQTQTMKREANLKAIIGQCVACLKCPLFGENMCPVEKKSFMKQMEIYFLFCMKMLLFLNLINGVGHPIGLAGIATHLHYREPGNLMFIFFVQQGLFHNLCEQYSGRELQEKILIVLCTIFTSEFVPAWEKKKKYRNSKVILDPLPKQFADAIAEYNQVVKEIFLRNLQTYNQCSETNFILPVSKENFFFRENDENNDPASVINKVRETFCCYSSSVLNPCIAITGTKDIDVDFLNIDFFSPLKECFYFDKSFLPSVPYPFVDHCGDMWSRNAYGLDFYRHNIPLALQIDNGLMEGDVYNYLKDFMLTIKAISVSLDYLSQESDPVVEAFRQLSENYSCYFSRAYKGGNF